MKTLQRSLAKFFAPTRRDTSAATKASAASRKVKSLLAQYPSIRVQKDRLSSGTAGFWVTCTVWEDDENSDPLRGNQFAFGWEEVLECVTVYAKAIEALPA